MPSIVLKTPLTSHIWKQTSLELFRQICEIFSSSEETQSPFFLIHDGRIITMENYQSFWAMLSSEDSLVLEASPRLLGGKGGFGSMLRAIGAQIEKTTNRDACRDLSGRRLRDVNNEKKIAEWLAKKQKSTDQSDEKLKLREEKLRKLLEGDHKHMLPDDSYNRQLDEIQDRVAQAVEKGLEKGEGVVKKRTAAEEPRASKRTSVWLDLSSSSDEEKDGDSACCSKDCRQPLACPDNLPAPRPDGGRPDTSSTNAISSRGFSSYVDPSPGSALTCDGCIIADIAPLLVKHLPVDAEASSSSTNSSSLPIDSIISSEVSLAQTKQVETDSDLGNMPVVADIKPALNLEDFRSAKELESVGLDGLKAALSALGLKCGGTLQMRAERLFLTKHTPIDQLPASVFVRPPKY